MHSFVVTRLLYATALCIALFVWAAFESFGGFFHRVDRGARRCDRGSNLALTALIVVGAVVACVCVQDVPDAAFPSWQPAIFWIGIVLMGAGIMFRWYAIRALGSYFTHSVATRPDQTVVERGPYRWIRHPSYSGALIIVLGAGLATINWLALRLVLACAIIGYAYRVHVEEQALCEALGGAYRDYMRRTRRFIPFVW